MSIKIGPWFAGDIVTRPHSRRASCAELKCRQVVVIDPAGAEDMERLAEIYASATHGDLNDYPLSIPALHMQAALREFANPTPLKIDEPLGLGVRVTDHGGLEWAARTGLHPAPDGMGLIERRWGCLNGGAKNCTWDELCDTRGPLTVEVAP